MQDNRGWGGRLGGDSAVLGLSWMRHGEGRTWYSVDVSAVGAKGHEKEAKRGFQGASRWNTKGIMDEKNKRTTLGIPTWSPI